MKSKVRKNKINDEQSDNLCVIPTILEGSFLGYAKITVLIILF